jgi:hypothetical protein
MQCCQVLGSYVSDNEGITVTILDIMCHPAFYLKYDVSETEFCLRLKVRKQAISFYWAHVSWFQ